MFFTKTLFINHLKKKPDVIVTTENETFDTMKEFLLWKEQEELRNVFSSNNQVTPNRLRPLIGINTVSMMGVHYITEINQNLGKTTIKEKQKKRKVKTGPSVQQR